MIFFIVLTNPTVVELVENSVSFPNGEDGAVAFSTNESSEP
jgi:hypothetical protein